MRWSSWQIKRNGGVQLDAIYLLLQTRKEGAQRLVKAALEGMSKDGQFIVMSGLKSQLSWAFVGVDRRKFYREQ